MNIWQDLMKFSLIGTERQTAPLTADGELQPYIAQLYSNNTVANDNTREQAFLTAAALVTQYRLAGYQPETFNGVLPEADTSEALPLLSFLAINQLQRLLNDNELKVILPEWLNLAAKTECRVPYRLIPSLLDLAAGNRKLRPAITALISKRGVWLAKQHSEWHKLLVQTAQDASIWEEGNAAEREEYLKQLRTEDPEQARKLLQAVWKQEPAATRQAFLMVLQHGLSDADEAFLNDCLNDRSKSVKLSVANLLARLPNSAYSLRQKQRLSACVQLEKGLLKKTLMVTPPEQYDATWQLDGIEEKAPQGKGQKAFWLEQLLSSVPPSYWSETWQLSPEAIFDLLKKHEWRDSLIKAWRVALQNHPDGAWAKTFLLHLDLNDSDLWKTLNPEQAEQLATQLLTQTHDKNLGKILLVLTQLQHAWTDSFSQYIVNVLNRYSQLNLSQTEIYGLYYLADIARYLHPNSYHALNSMIENLSDELAFKRTLNKLLYILSFRHDMLLALTQPQ